MCVLAFLGWGRDERRNMDCFGSGLYGFFINGLVRDDCMNRSNISFEVCHRFFSRRDDRIGGRRWFIPALICNRNNLRRGYDKN